MEEKTIHLGGNIELVDFTKLDDATMIILKKMIGNQVRKMTDAGINITQLRLELTSYSEEETTVQGSLGADRGNSSTTRTGENIFMTVNDTLEILRREL